MALVSFEFSKSLGTDLLLLTLPTVVMLTLAGIGLILGRFFGYWCAYLATFFGGIGGLKVSFVPFIQRYINLGPNTGDFFLALNLVIIGILVWEHFLRLNDLEWERRKVHRVMMGVILIAGLASVTAGRVMQPIGKGTAGSAGAVPVVGSYFEKLQTTGAVRYVYVHSKLVHGIDLTMSGQATELGVRAMVAEHGLKPLEKPEAYQKILPRTRRWKLGEENFPTQFASPDLLFIGRPKSGDQAVIQIAWRKSDSKFTAEMLGTIIESAPSALVNRQ